MTAAVAPLPERLAQLETLKLDSGAHPSFGAGHCAMELVSWLAGEPHSDAPACACPVVARAVMRLNDRIPDKEERTRLLRPLLPRVVGSRVSWPTMVKRALVAADYAVRVFAPITLDARGHGEKAASLRSLAPVVDVDTAKKASKAAAAAAAAVYAAADAAAAAAYAAAYDDADDADDAAAADAADAAADAAAAADAYAAAYAARSRVYAEVVRMIEAMLAITDEAQP